MGNMDIKAIIFDFGNVIGGFDHMIICRKLAKLSDYPPEEIYGLVFKSGIEKEYDEGLPFKEFHKKVMRAINLNDKISLEEFENIWGDIFSENLKTEEVLEKIPSHIKMFLLSNTNPVHWKQIKKLPIISRFFCNTKQQILSFKVGERKPSKKIYLEGIARTGVPINQIVYIDDNPEFVQAFIELGGNGIIYDSTKNTVEKLKQGLTQFGVIK